MSEHVTSIKQSSDSRWKTLGIVMVIGTVADQITKKIADARLRDVGIVEVVEGYFQLRYSRNPGAFFSLGANLPPLFRRTFFITSTIVAMALMVKLYKDTPWGQKALRWALVLLLTGAVGNLIDRVLYGEVVDFLHLHWEDVFHWATFNVADMCISAGLCLLLWDLFTTGARGAREDRK
jgi:signal peptidase II